MLPRFKGKFKARFKKRTMAISRRKRVCRFCTDKNRVIDYKDIKTLEYFIKERGKIISTRFSGNCAKHQRRLTEAVKRARFIALVPYVRY